MVWTRQDGNMYREVYPTYSFKQKQQIMNSILKVHIQPVEPAIFLLYCLALIGKPVLRVVELGGYDGSHALDVLKLYPEFSWLNYDISEVAVKLTRFKLKKFNYSITLLNQPFINETLKDFDLFYTSKTLEHLTLEEVKQTLTATRKAKYQVHIIDWFWDDDTHVIEPKSHSAIINHLAMLGYEIQHVDKLPWQSHIFAQLPHG